MVPSWEDCCLVPTPGKVSIVDGHRVIPVSRGVKSFKTVDREMVCMNPSAMCATPMNGPRKTRKLTSLRSSRSRLEFMLVKPPGVFSNGPVNIGGMQRVRRRTLICSSTGR